MVDVNLHADLYNLETLFYWVILVSVYVLLFLYRYTGCPTTYQTRHFFNNSKTNEDIATRF
jgi:hypothetical protein